MARRNVARVLLVVYAAAALLFVSGAESSGRAGSSWAAAVESLSTTTTVVRRLPRQQRLLGALTGGDGGGDGSGSPPTQTSINCSKCGEVPFTVDVDVKLDLVTAVVTKYTVNVTRSAVWVKDPATGRFVTLLSLAPTPCQQAMDAANPTAIRIKIDTLADVGGCTMTAPTSWMVTVNGAPVWPTFRSADQAVVSSTATLLVPLTFIRDSSTSPPAASVVVTPPAGCDSDAALLGAASPYPADPKRIQYPLNYTLIWPTVSAGGSCSEFVRTPTSDPGGGGGGLSTCEATVTDNDCSRALCSCHFAVSDIGPFAERNPKGCKACTTNSLGFCGSGSTVRYCCALNR